MTAYALGVDLGTASIAAAVGRDSSWRALALDPSRALVSTAGLTGADRDQLAVALARPLRAAIERATQVEGEAPSLVVLATSGRDGSPDQALVQRVADVAGIALGHLLVLTRSAAAAIGAGDAPARLGADGSLAVASGAALAGSARLATTPDARPLGPAAAPPTAVVPTAPVAPTERVPVAPPSAPTQASPPVQPPPTASVPRVAPGPDDRQVAGAPLGAVIQPQTVRVHWTARHRNAVIAGVAAVVVAVLALVGVLALTGDDDETAPATTPAPTPVTTAPPATTVAPTTTAAPTTTSAPTTTAAPTTTVAPTTTEVPAGRGVEGVVRSVALGPASGSRIVAISAVPDGGDDAVGGGVVVATDAGSLTRIDASGTTELFVVSAADGAPGGLAVAPDGTLYVSVARGLLQVDGGAASLVIDAGDADLGATPGAVAIDADGNVYLADVDTNRILRLDTDGDVRVVAGTGEPAPSGAPTGDGDPADEVPIGAPVGLAVCDDGTIWFLDATTRTVRVVDPDGELGTVTGTGATPVAPAGAYLDDDTPLGDVVFGTLDGLALDPEGGVYVTDAGSGAILRLIDGAVSVVAARNPGTSAVDGVPMNRSSVRSLGAVAVDADGSVWFRDAASLRVIAP
ncbi:MAG: hypothetical protein U0Q03_05990 [Acidimicrobiales bacterium]